jgi:ketosteroid isomerase-like protein
MTRRTGLAALIGFVTLAGIGLSAANQARDLRTPQAVVDELLAADRTFAAAAARTDVPGALGPMLAADVVFGPVPGSRFARGHEEAVASLRANPDNAGARLEWAPVRGGISADGQQGFTFGFMTLHQADGTAVPIKYMAYWIRQPVGWRAVAYKRGRRPAGEVSLAMMPAALPDRLVAISTDPATLAGHQRSLDQAERDFSDEAQHIGLGAAFAKWGSEDAVNMGGPDSPGYLVGAAAIGASIGTGSPGTTSPVFWAPESVIVASSGDLGITIGRIRPHAPAADGIPAAGVPFFTIWRRAGPGAPWRYIAE